MQNDRESSSSHWSENSALAANGTLVPALGGKKTMQIRFKYN